jgi:anti-sigma B factor antagonist
MFSVDLRTRESGGHVVVELRGELDLADAAGVAAALAAVAAREPQIIVDLAALEFIDSSGVAALARGRKQARRAGGDLLLAAPGPRVLRILTITRLIDAFSVHDSVEEAARAIGFCVHASVEEPGRDVRSPLTAAWPVPWRRINRLRLVRTFMRSASRPPESGPSPCPPQAGQVGA